MSKIVLDEVTSGNNITKINENFSKIASSLNDQVLYRDNPVGEPNAVSTDIDMNGKRLYNLPNPTLPGEPLRLQDLQDVTNGITDANLIQFSPTATISSTNVQGAIEEVVSDLLPASGSGTIGFSYANTYPVHTIGKSLITRKGIDITQAPYNADPTGVADSGPAISAAWAASQGVPLYAPTGTYLISTKPVIKTSIYDGIFGAGFKLFGDGINKTIFLTAIANDAMFDIDSTANHAIEYKAAIGVELEGFTIKRSGVTANTTAIKLTTCYLPRLHHINISGMSAHGIHIPCIVGDNDGSNMITLDQVRIENCAGWGIKADGDVGRNETSFIIMNHVFVNGCGTANVAATPPSGGMIWKGQIFTMQQCAFTLNENCALFIPGGAGLANSVDLQNTTFENNRSRGLYCTGVSSFKGRNLQFYNDNSFVSTVACEFDGSSSVVRQVVLDGVVVRATSSNNPYIAFKISGVNANLDTCRVRNVVWDNFDYAGQIRFSGWQFDKVERDCEVVITNATTVVLRPRADFGHGAKMPCRLRGGIGGVPSNSGEWIATQLSNIGLSISNSGLVSNTVYYVYLFDNNGVFVLELSTTSPIIELVNGYMVKSTDTTKLFCGKVVTNGSTQFPTTGTGWLNPMFVPASQAGTYNRMWVDASGVLRMRAATIDPTSDTDGVVIGSQV